jgi:hypothetical protein
MIVPAMAIFAQPSGRVASADIRAKNSCRRLIACLNAAPAILSAPQAPPALNVTIVAVM